MELAEVFANDNQGRRFKDVVEDPRLSFASILQFFDDASRQRRMLESEQHHDRPPLAGVIRELEGRPDVHHFFMTNDGRTTTRFRQAVGVIVRIIMETHGWRTTGRKGSLGVKMDAAQRSSQPGAYHNTGGLSLWFVRAERYRMDAMPFQAVSERAREVDLALAKVA